MLILEPRLRGVERGQFEAFLTHHRCGFVTHMRVFRGKGSLR
jgi:hypothetical protein